MAVDLPDWQTRSAIGTDTSGPVFTLQPNVASGTIDTTGLASVVINPNGTVILDDGTLQLSWLDDSGNIILLDSINLKGMPAAQPLNALVARCRTDALQLTWTGSENIDVTITGSQRQPEPLEYAGALNWDTFVSPSAAMVAGTFYGVGSQVINGPGGWAQLDFEVTGTTVTGTLFLQTSSGFGSNNLLMLADTAEAHTDVNIRLVSKQVIIPAGRYLLYFLCRTAGTAIVVANLGYLPR